MAVQQNRKTRSKRGMRRAHDHLKEPALSVDPLTGEVHRRHHLTATGYYKGQRVLNTDTYQEVPSEANEDDQEDS